MFLWLANYANSCALQACGITLTYIVKACIPVLTVAICALRGQRFPLPIFLSLVPICLGVAVASFSDVAFSLQGFLAALLSAVAQAFLNLSIKEVTARTQYSGPVAFMGMSIIWYVKSLLHFLQCAVFSFYLTIIILFFFVVLLSHFR